MKYLLPITYSLLMLFIMLEIDKNSLYAAEGPPSTATPSYYNGYGLTEGGLATVKVTIQPHAAFGSTSILNINGPIEVSVPFELIFSTYKSNPFLNLHLSDIKKAVFDYLESIEKGKQFWGFFLRENPNDPQKQIFVPEKDEISAEEINSGEVYLRLTHNDKPTNDNKEEAS